MIVVHEETAPTLETAEPCRRALKVFLSPALHGEGLPIAVGMTVLPPGGNSDEHAHVEGEMFYILEGSGCIGTVDGPVAVTPGTTVWSPPGERHQLINNGTEVLRILWVLSPPGREAAILEAAGAL